MQDGDQSGGARRPRVTIEGKAREVRKGRGSSSGTGPRGAKADPGPAASAAEPGASAVNWRERLIVAAIGAGAAVVVVFVIIAGLRYGSDTTARLVGALSGAGAPGDAVAGLREDIDALRARLASDDRLTERLDELERRGGRLEARLAEAESAAAGASEANAARVGEVEERFAELDAAAAATSEAVAGLEGEIAAAAGSGTSLAAVATRLARATAGLDALSGRISGLEQNLSALSGEAATAGAAARRAAEARRELAGRLAALEEGGAPAAGTADGSRLGALEARIARLSERADRLALPGAVSAHTALADRAAAGEAFERELAVLRAALGDEPALAALATYAAEPPPTADDLAGRLDGLGAPGNGPNAPDPGTSDETGDGIISQLIARAGRAVEVRRVGEGSASGGPGEARVLIEAGDIAGAIAVVGSAAAGPDAGRWLADARARLALDRAVADLGAALDRRLADQRSG